MFRAEYGEGVSARDRMNAFLRAKDARTSWWGIRSETRHNRPEFVDAICMGITCREALKG